MIEALKTISKNRTQKLKEIDEQENKTLSIGNVGYGLWPLRESYHILPNIITWEIEWTYACLAPHIFMYILRMYSKMVILSFLT